MLFVRADAGLSYAPTVAFICCSSESSVSCCSAALKRSPSASLDEDTTVCTTSVSRFALADRCGKAD